MDKVGRLANKETGTAEIGPLNLSNLQVFWQATLIELPASAN